MVKPPPRPPLCFSITQLHTPLSQITLLLHCSLIFSDSWGGITRQGQVEGVLEYFPTSLCLALGCDEQKEHQASCACRDGSCLAGTHHCLGFGGLAVTTPHSGPEQELGLGLPVLVWP